MEQDPEKGQYATGRLLGDHLLGPVWDSDDVREVAHRYKELYLKGDEEGAAADDEVAGG